MRIGYISYEHPLGISGGGIGTYLGQIARLMSRGGHEVEVFTCHPEYNNSIEHDGYWLHRIQANSNADFRQKAVAVFAERQAIQPFDIIEAAEYGADAILIKKKFPYLPLVVKLHTPSYLTQQLNDYKTSPLEKARFLLGGLLRGKLPKRYWVYRKEDDPEYEQYCLADALCSPSKSLAEIIKETWPGNKPVAVIPNPFVADQSFLNIPVADPDGEAVVSFFGRLEKRKGILQLMKAIPIVLQHNTNIVFQFVGKSHPSPVKGMDMEEYLKHKLKRWTKQLRFFGYQPYSNMPALLANTHICVFPSLWENFPNVCLEAMVSGRVVVASGNGGMADMITHNEQGILVSPKSPEDIAKAIIGLVSNPTEMKRLGIAAREKVIEEYNETKTSEIVSNFYQSTLGQLSAESLQAKFA